MGSEAAPRQFGLSRFTIAATQFEISGRYSPIRAVGRGAYGVVVSAIDSVSGRQVAIKRISDAYRDVLDTRRTLTELLLLRTLHHSNIVEMMDLMRPPDGSVRPWMRGKRQQQSAACGDDARLACELACLLVVLTRPSGCRPPLPRVWLHGHRPCVPFCVGLELFPLTALVPPDASFVLQCTRSSAAHSLSRTSSAPRWCTKSSEA